METALRDINAVIGVTGSFVCSPEGTVVAQAMPQAFECASLDLVARVATQTFQALDTSGQRSSELDLLFGQSRLILKNLRGGILVILCARTINLPLLNLTANVAAKRISAALKAAKASLPIETAAAPEPAPIAPAMEREVAPSPLLVELQQETAQIIEAGRQARVLLRALDPVPLWVCCSHTRHLLAAPDRRQMDFAGRSGQSNSIIHIFEQCGYQPNQRFNAFYGGRRLNFSNPQRDLSADVHLDSFSMYHHLDLGPVLEQEEETVPETTLCLLRLQLVEITDAFLGDLCGLFLEHDLSVGPAKEKINAAQITDLCADDWGWYRTVSMNLDRVAAFAATKLDGPDRVAVVDRVHLLRSRIESAPKSLRWQMRARVGDGARWYETPVTVQSRPRPDIAIG